MPETATAEASLGAPVALEAGAWFVYDHAWLDEREADELLSAARDELAWEQREIVAFGKPILQPRLNAWAGEIDYKYSGQILEARPWPAWLAALRDRIEAATGAAFNHVLLNLYRDGRDSVAMHADNEPELGKDPVVASISLGATRRFVLECKRDRKQRRSMRLVHGSLLLMGGTMQHSWRHAVPKDPKVDQPRVNLTFRRLLGPPGWRGPDDG